MKPRRFGLFAAFSLLSGWLVQAQQNDLDSPLKTIVTTGAEDRNELASELVAMLYEARPGESDRAAGAATVIGTNGDCLYLATADHVARDPNGNVRTLSARTRWLPENARPVTVLNVHDAPADLGVLCIPKPQQLFVPFPRVPFFLLGDPGHLTLGDVVTFFGQGNGIAWHTKSETMTYASTAGDLLTVRGGDIQQGDSGGALFQQQEGFNALIGIISKTSGGETKALSISVVIQEFRKWGLPVNLEGWNYRDANHVLADENNERALQVGTESPPKWDRELNRLKCLAVSVSGGPDGRRTGLLLAAKNSTVWIRVPWKSANAGSPPHVTFATGFGVDGAYVPGDRADESFVTAQLPAEQLSAMELAPPPGIVLGVPPPSSLQVPVMPWTGLTMKTTTFLVGVDSAGSWRVSPRDLKIADASESLIKLSGGAINPLSIGWLAFDDRNRLIGFVSAVHDTSLDVTQVQDLGNSVIPSEAVRLQNWRPSNLPLQVLAGGADLHCPNARAIGYGRNEEADDLMLTPGGLVVASQTRMMDYVETEVFTLKLSRFSDIVSARRSRIAGQKGTERLVKSEDHNHAFVVGQVRLPGDAADASAEPHWCGLVDEVDSIGPATLIKPVEFCGKPTHFLPEAALVSQTHKIVFAGGKAENDRVVTATVVAAAAMDGSVQELLEDKTSVWFGGAAYATDGAIFAVGYGQGNGESHAVTVTKAKLDGTVIWNVTEPYAERQVVRGVAAMDDGSVVVAGYSSPKNATRPLLRIWRFSYLGKLEWSRDFALGVEAEINDVIGDGSNIVIVGDVYWPDTTGKSSEDSWILELNGQGNIVWQETYSWKYALHRRLSRFRRVLKTTDGYIALGEGQGSGANGTVLWLVQLGLDGLPRHTAVCSQ